MSPKERHFCSRMWLILLGMLDSARMTDADHEALIWWRAGLLPKTPLQHVFLDGCRKDMEAGRLSRAEQKLLQGYEKRCEARAQKAAEAEAARIKAGAEKAARIKAGSEKAAISQPQGPRPRPMVSAHEPIDAVPSPSSVYSAHRAFVWSLLLRRRTPSTEAQKSVMAWWQEGFRPKTPRQHDIENGILVEYRQGRLSGEEARAWNGFIKRRAAWARRGRRIRDTTPNRSSRGQHGDLPRCIGEAQQPRSEGQP